MIWVIAHAGHWYVSLVYVAPVLILLAMLAFVRLRDRRRRRAGADGRTAGTTDDTASGQGKGATR